MLADKDRIFTNIYGWETHNLPDAQKRGDWDGTKDILAKGRDWIIEEMKTHKVSSDNFKGAYDATAELLKNGFKHIAHAWDRFIPSAVKYLEEQHSAIKLIKAILGEKAALIGACCA